MASPRRGLHRRCRPIEIAFLREAIRGLGAHPRCRGRRPSSWGWYMICYEVAQCSYQLALYNAVSTILPLATTVPSSSHVKNSIPPTPMSRWESCSGARETRSIDVMAHHRLGFLWLSWRRQGENEKAGTKKNAVELCCSWHMVSCTSRYIFCPYRKIGKLK